MTRRLLGGAGLALAGLLLVSGTALAGGWATIAADSGNAAQPNAGEPTDLGFTVLQHGMTAAGWVNAIVVLENPTTGEALRVAARPEGVNGHFVATVTFPDAGFWSWRVELAELVVESPPVTATVLTADGALPAFDPATVLTVIDQAKLAVRTEMTEQFQGRIDALEAQLATGRSETTTLELRLASALADREALETRVSVLEGGGGVPLVGLLTIAALVGGVAGFGLTILAGPRRVREIAPGAPDGVPVGAGATTR